MITLLIFRHRKSLTGAKSTRNSSTTFGRQRRLRRIWLREASFQTYPHPLPWTLLTSSPVLTANASLARALLSDTYPSVPTCYTTNPNQLRQPPSALLPGATNCHPGELIFVYCWAGFPCTNLKNFKHI